MASRGHSAFGAIINAAYYTPIEANAPPDNVIFTMPFVLRQNRHIPIACPDHRTLALTRQTAFRLLMAMINLCAHANGTRSSRQGSVRTCLRLEVLPSKERHGRRTAIGYRYWFYVMDDNLAARAPVADAMNLDDAAADAMSAQAAAEAAAVDVAAQLANLQVQAADTDGANNEEHTAPIDDAAPAPAPSMRTALANEVPLEQAFQNQTLEGGILHNQWLRADIEAASRQNAAKKKQPQRGRQRQANGPLTTTGINEALVIDETLSYHLNGDSSFYQSIIGPYLDEDHHAMWIGGHNTDFLDDVILETEPSDPSEPHEAAWMRKAERQRALAYYNPLRRHRGSEVMIGGPKTFRDTRMPWHYFSLTQTMFQFCENLAPECCDITQYATYPRDLGADEDGNPIQLQDMLSALPRRRQLAYLESIDFCDTFHDRYPFPNLVFDVAPEALFPEVFLEAGFPLPMGRPIPPEYFTEPFVDAYAECYRVSIASLMPHMNIEEEHAHEDGVDEAILKRSVVRRLVQQARGRLANLHNTMKGLLQFNMRAPQKPAYPLTKQKMAEYMVSRKSQYLQARAGGNTMLVSSALHHEWTHTSESTFLTIPSAARAVRDSSNQMAREMRRAMLDTGGGDDSHIALGMISDAVLFGTEDMMDAETAEQMKDATKEMDPEVAVRDMCVFRRLGHTNGEVHAKVRESHYENLQKLNRDLFDRQILEGKAEEDCEQVDLDDYIPYRQELLLCTAQMARECWHEFNNSPDVSAGVAPARKWYQNLLPDRRILPIADTRVSARPSTMYRSAMYTYLNDVLAVSSLYTPLLTAFYASLDAIVFTETEEEATLNMGMVGSAFGGKSFVLSAVQKTRVPGTVLSAAHITDQFFNVSANMDDLVLMFNEMKKSLLIENEKGENSDSINMFKSRITSRVTRVAYFRYDEETGKRTYGITIAPCSGVVMFATNDDLSRADPALISRFYIYGVGHRKLKLFGTAIQERELHEEMVNRLEQNEYTHIQRLLHYYTLVMEKMIQAKVFRETPATTFISDKLVNYIFEKLKDEEGIARPDRRAYRRVCRLARVLHVAYAVWVTHATPFYLYAYPSKESVRWSMTGRDGNEYHYEDDGVELSEEAVEACIARGQPPQWTPDVLVYLLAPFMGVQKEAVMEAFCLLRTEFMSIDSEHVLRYLAQIAQFGVDPASKLTFVQRERRQGKRSGTAAAAKPASTTAANTTTAGAAVTGMVDDGPLIDANYIEIPTEDMNVFLKRVANSFVTVRPSEVQVKMALSNLSNTLYKMDNLEYDAPTGTLSILPTRSDRPLVKSIYGRGGRMTGLAVSTGYLMALLKLTVSEVNEGGLDSETILPASTTVGNPGRHRFNPPTNPDTWRRGAWNPPAPLNVVDITCLKDAQNYAVVRYDDPLMRVLARTFEGPNLERSELPMATEAFFHAALASPDTGVNPVFDYGISHSPPPYKLHSLDSFLSKEDRKAKRLQGSRTAARAGEMRVERPEDLRRDRSIIDTAGICGILRLRRLGLRDGGNVIRFEQHTQIHEATRRFFPINRKRSRENSVAQRLLEASSIEFTNLDVDYIVAQRSAKVIGSPPLPLRTRLREQSHFALDKLKDQPHAFAPFTMVYLSVFNELEAERHGWKNDDGTLNVDLEVTPALTLAEDINRRIGMCGPNEERQTKNSAGQIMLNRSQARLRVIQEGAGRTSLEQLTHAFTPAQISWMLKRPGAFSALPDALQKEMKAIEVPPPDNAAPSQRMQLALNPEKLRQQAYAREIATALAQPAPKRQRREFQYEVPGQRRAAPPPPLPSQQQRPSMQRMAQATYDDSEMDVDAEFLEQDPLDNLGFADTLDAPGTPAFRPKPARPVQHKRQRLVLQSAYDNSNGSVDSMDV